MAGEEPFDQLATHYGIVGAYQDFDGRQVTVSGEAKRSLLAAMGVEAQSESQAQALLLDIGAAAQSRRCRPEHILASLEPASIAIKGACDWRLCDEGGREVLCGQAEGAIALPPLVSGIYGLELDYPGGSEEATLIASPAQAPRLDDIAGSGRLWGVTAALYGLRSRRNAGIGDYADLGAAAEALAQNGADFLGINPVHAPGIAERDTISPYSPTSRSHYNIGLIAFDAIRELADFDRYTRFLRENAREIKALRNAELIDYEAVRRMRACLLEMLFERYRTMRGRLEAGRGFRSFAEERGESLRLFALYETISEAHGPDWRKWPASLKDPRAPGAVSFARQNEERVGFHCWLQWIADRQLAGAHEKAMAAGMALGLYLDIPVGSRPGGAESWTQPEAIAGGVSLGAPPDAFSPQGQKWNLAPYCPEGLKRSRYRPISRMLRTAMRHAGMVRIDHALGLSRSFWICESDGASGYVRYPLEALLAVIAIEAERSRTIVIGEDLGLVAPEFREKMQRAGLFGCTVMQFERDREGRFNDPRAWRAMSLGSFGTHDTPTFEGFRQARDIEWGRRLSRGSLEDPAEARAGRRHALARLFGSMGISEASAGGDRISCVDKMHVALARSGSSIVAAQLDDVLGAVEQQNLPGTINEHPNWRRRCRLPVEELAGAQSLSRLGKIMAGNGRGSRSGADREGKKRKDGP